MLSAAPQSYIFNLNRQTFISIAIMLFNAVFLAVALTYLLYKPVRRFMYRRAEAIRTQMSDADENMDKAKELIALYEKKLEELEDERLSVLETARERAIERSSQILLEAENDAAALKERVNAEIQNKYERLNEDIRLHIIEVASAMAEKIVAYAIDEDTHNRLFEETVAQLEEKIWQS